jgi:hypothetical protein
MWADVLRGARCYRTVWRPLIVAPVHRGSLLLRYAVPRGPFRCDPFPGGLWSREPAVTSRDHHSACRMQGDLINHEHPRLVSG